MLNYILNAMEYKYECIRISPFRIGLISSVFFVYLQNESKSILYVTCLSVLGNVLLSLGTRAHKLALIYRM